MYVIFMLNDRIITRQQTLVANTHTDTHSQLGGRRLEEWGVGVGGLLLQSNPVKARWAWVNQIEHNPAVTLSHPLVRRCLVPHRLKSRGGADNRTKHHP